MSKLKKLIQNFCPNGVQYKKIKELAEVGTGSSNRNEAVENGKYPFFVRSKNIERMNNFEYDEEAIIIPGEGGIGDIFHYINGKYALHQRVYRIHFYDKEIKTKFIYYYFSAYFKKFIMKKAVSATVTSIRKPMIEEFLVPIPPMEVQNEIVRILDNFTEIEAELEAELEARKKQYEFYRDKMLTFSNNVKIVKFGDVAQIQRGASPRPISKFITNDENAVNWIKIGDVMNGAKYVNHCSEKITIEGAKKSRFVRKGDFILSNSMSFGRPYILKINGCIHDGWLSISNFKKYFVSDFLYYLLSSSKIQNEFKKKASFGGAVQNLNADIVKEIELPMPPIKEQKEIVNILDRFDKLCNDNIQGLPAEIEARKKQYEYYRDKLLDFKELKVEK